MSDAIFYLLPEQSDAPARENIYLIAGQLARIHYANNVLVYIHCNDKNQAYDMDELLWQFEANSFVPHNLKGEGPVTGAPVEIGFDHLGPNKLRQVLINLADQSPSFAVNFDLIIDFVASDDGLKAIARERYKQYRALGISLNTQDLATNPLHI